MSLCATMQNLYNTAAIRIVEEQCFAKEDSFAVMQKAGGAVAQCALDMLAHNDSRLILVIAGPGNNGGDALIAAAQLRAAGKNVTVTMLADEQKLPQDAKRALAQWINISNTTPRRHVENADYALAIDGLLGIGINRAVSDEFAAIMRQLRNLPTLSIDIPSGINADNGKRYGEAVIATRTITFFAAKSGLYTGEGPAHAGQIIVHDLGFSSFPPANGALIDSIHDLNLPILKRHINSHKGTYGALAIIGGGDGMQGALTLATRAATRLGAGKVFAASTASTPPALDWHCPEIMYTTPQRVNFSKVNCIAIGPGLGMDNMGGLLEKIIDLPMPLIVDADALNLLAADNALRQKFSTRPAASIITPHPAEAARLLQCHTQEINDDRIAAAVTLATNFNTVTTLKGANSIVATARQWTICPTGNPGLAQAGAGDSLTGIIAALLCQTQDAKFSATAGVWLHGSAADNIASASGEIGLNLNALPQIAATMLNRHIQLSS